MNTQQLYSGMRDTMGIEERVCLVREIGQNHDDQKWRDDSETF